MTFRFPIPAETQAVSEPTLAHKPRRLVAQPLIRAVTWLLSLIIVALSVVPASMRPITAVPHKLEHIVTFMVWGAAFALCYRVNYIYQMAAAVLFAMAIEIAQYCVPGRHARISDFVTDAVAACVSIVLTRIFSGRLTT
jgi:VanZ family protein